MVEHLVDMLAPLDFRVAQQVIDVPKIVCPSLAARTVLRAQQLAEQLAEAPTLVSLVRIFEQTVAIPGRAGGRGVTGGLQGSLFAAEQIGLHPGHCSTALAAQIVDIPVPHGGRQDPDLPSAASSSGLRDTANRMVFSHFPRGNRVHGWVRARGRNFVRNIVHPRRLLT